MRKRLFLIFILSSITISCIQLTFAAKEKFPDVKIKDIPVIELEPTEFYSFNEYKENDLKFQQEYSGEWSTLYQINLDKYLITSIASSNLGKDYVSSNLYDGREETAWVEGAQGSGINEWIKIKIDAYRGVSEVTSTPFSVEEIGIIPGYAKNQKTWSENNRVKSLIIIVQSPPMSYPQGNEWVVFRLKLEDKNELQYFSLPRDKIAHNDTLMTKTIWIKIEEVYKGTKYDDTCISELVLYGGCSN